MSILTLRTRCKLMPINNNNKNLIPNWTHFDLVAHMVTVF